MGLMSCQQFALASGDTATPRASVSLHSDNVSPQPKLCREPAITHQRLRHHQRASSVPEVATQQTTAKKVASMERTVRSVGSQRKTLLSFCSSPLNSSPHSRRSFERPRERMKMEGRAFRSELDQQSGTVSLCVLSLLLEKGNACGT